ncbi:DUF6070 family protein [Anaerosacchariphilus polymeriproducens]|uniref:Lipoprotein n=1 Tax=Anaerosacchariphilus polymeriproducens TaxID=1812858 RepID=A0A371ATA2_9FIRM|nr:DUF6070 family protein [Anaerosacchariphilus polymeriproducens]RDU22791.1 hypothetical protein DWV06_12640 [Anaerosacchariphilus polymeriproducens]
MNPKKIVLLLMSVVVCTFLFVACKQGKGLEEKELLAVEKQKKDKGSKREVDVKEKGYDLPVNDEDRIESETDCKMVMNRIKKIYEKADKGEAANVAISNKTAEKMQNVVETIGYPVTINGFHYNMCNYEKMEAFLIDSLEGKKGEIILYEIYFGGNICRRKFIYDGSDMYVLDTGTSWNEKNEPTISATSYNKIKNWKYTEKGWFIFEYCVPEPPEVSEVINGNVMVRVKPLNEEFNRIAEKCLCDLGYQGNNLLCSNWDANHMEDLDYNGLFQYLYFIKHKKQFDSEQYSKGIPKEEFESLMKEFLPVTAEELQQYAVFDPKSQTYSWTILGCRNYSPNAFGTSAPEVTDIKENVDKTVTLTIDVVCEMAGSDAVMSHQLTVQFLEDGGIRYLKNEILNDGLAKIPAYQYRFKRGK